MNSALSAGTSSLGKIELVGQTGTHAPQSMQPLGSTYNWVAASNCSSSFLGWMQSVGQASTQSSSLVQVSVMVYAMIAVLLELGACHPHRQQSGRVVRHLHCTNSATSEAVMFVTSLL